MTQQFTNELFCDYYERWIEVYKQDAVRSVTMGKYRMTHKWLVRLVPTLQLKDIDRIAYQRLLNAYAAEHERQTVMDFHHQVKGAILDAVDDGLIPRDPTRKAVIKGKTPRVKKEKYLNQFQLQTLLASLHLENEVNWDYFILLVAKTGMRFSEALALTPEDFDFKHQLVSVSKTWDYKNGTGFLPTKNLPKSEPIFVNGAVYNSTINGILKRYCGRLGIPVVSIHGLRHTHASLLLFAGVSIASVARRLGHSSINTTQKTYVHIVQELENQDVDLVMRLLSSLT